jgi:threonine/homoserine/homoserine lactone efflux protein
MLGIADYGAFCAAILVFLALPGPGTFALLTSTGKGGFRAGAAATLGAPTAVQGGAVPRRRLPGVDRPEADLRA